LSVHAARHERWRRRQSGNASLHVGDAASPDRAIRELRRERVETPFRRVAHRHYIGMAREDKERRARAEAA